MTRVLVADDSETILLLLRTRLEMEGYEVSTAADGQEVVEALAETTPGEEPDLILLDAMMPRMSGLDVLRTLRDEGSETPILIVSAPTAKRRRSTRRRAWEPTPASRSRSTSRTCWAESRALRLASCARLRGGAGGP